LFCAFAGYFCRRCCDLIYACQSISTNRRKKDRLELIYRRLGYYQSPNVIKRPKRMRQYTFRKLRRYAQRIADKLADRPRRTNRRSAYTTVRLPEWPVPR
jgi:hypothetical protein